MSEEGLPEWARRAAEGGAPVALEPTGNPLVRYETAPPENTHAQAPVSPRAQFVREQLAQREDDFVRRAPYAFWVGTWNVNGQESVESLLPWLEFERHFGGLPGRCCCCPDFCFVSLQEIDRRPEALILAASAKETLWNTMLLLHMQTAAAVWGCRRSSSHGAASKLAPSAHSPKGQSLPQRRDSDDCPCTSGTPAPKTKSDESSENNVSTGADGAPSQKFLHNGTDTDGCSAESARRDGVHGAEGARKESTHGAEHGAYPAHEYVLVASHSLVGIYAGFFARRDRLALLVPEEMRARAEALLAGEPSVAASHSYRATEELLAMVRVEKSSAGCGFMGTAGNKGGVALRVRVADEHVVFVSSHLAPHVHNVTRRNQDYAELVRRLAFPPAAASLPYACRPGGSVFDASAVFWAGDLNYRVDLDEATTRRLARENKLAALYARDQLRAQMRAGRAFEPFIDGTSDPQVETDSSVCSSISSLVADAAECAGRTATPGDNAQAAVRPESLDGADVGTTELGGPIRESPKTSETANDPEAGGPAEASPVRRPRTPAPFQSVPVAVISQPTFKYVLGTAAYDEGPKGRAPAWPDRILHRRGDRVRCVSVPHTAVAVVGSDHRPVAAGYAADLGAVDAGALEATVSAVLRALDAYENEAIPATELDLCGTVVDLGSLAYMRASAPASVVLRNTGIVLARFRFVAPPGRDTALPGWLDVCPREGILRPGAALELTVTGRVLDALDLPVPELRTASDSAADGPGADSHAGGRSGEQRLDTLILHIDGGRDHFVPVEAVFRRTAFGQSLDVLTAAGWARDATMPNPRRDYDLSFQGVPCVLVRLISHLTRLDTADAARVFLDPGDASALDAIQDALDALPGRPDAPLPASADAVSVGDAVLRFLDALPEPLVPRALFRSAIESDAVTSFAVFERMPLAHQEVFQYVRHFLREIHMPRVAADVAPETLAAAFAPVLLKPPREHAAAYGSGLAQLQTDARRVAFVLSFIH